MPAYLVHVQFDQPRDRWIVKGCNLATMGENFYKPFGLDRVGMWPFMVLTTNKPWREGWTINPYSVVCDWLKRRKETK